MAKKKLNKRFLLISGLVLAGVALGGAALFYKMRHRIDPDELVAIGKSHVEKHDYAEAVRYFGGALTVRGSDPSLRVMYGDALSHLAVKDREYYARARAEYQQALQIDPKHPEALRRLFKMAKDELEQSPQPSTLEETASLAKRLFEVDPNNLEARAYIDQVTLLRYQMSNDLELEEADAALQRMDQLSAEHPECPDALLFAARTRLVKASKLTSVNRGAARELIDSAVQSVRQRLQDRPEDAMAHLVAAQVTATAASFGQAQAQMERGDVARREAMDKAIALNEEAYRLAQRASELAKPEDGPRFVTARMLYADWARRRFDYDQAESALRSVIEVRPWDLQPRLELAELLAQRERTEESLKLLREPLPEAPELTGMQALMALYLESAKELAIARYELDSLNRQMRQSPKSLQERLKLVEPIEQALQSAITKYRIQADRPEVLRLQGGILVMKDQFAEAIKTLNRALGQLPGGDESARARLMRLEITLLLVTANMQLRQWEQARGMLESLLKEVPQFRPARELLVRLLIDPSVNDYASARPHVDYLLNGDPARGVKGDPDNPLYQRWQTLLLDPATLAERYKQMPEATRQERIEKMRVAARLKNYQEVVRIAQLMRHDNPSDREATLLQASALAEMGRKDEAKQVLREGLQADANMANAADLLAALEAETGNPEDRARFRREQAMKLEDPYRRNMALFNIARDEGKMDEAIGHLVEAEKTAPDSTAAELLFGHYAGLRDWTKAEQYLEKLAQRNADQASGRLYRARLLAAQGRIEDGLSLARQVTTDLPDLAAGWLTWAQLLQLQADPLPPTSVAKIRLLEEASSRYVQVIDRQSNNIDAVRGMIECLRQLGRFERAKPYIDIGRRLRPEDRAFRQLELSWEIAFGDPRKLIESRKQFVEADPSVAEHWRSLGVAYSGSVRRIESEGGPESEREKYLSLAAETFGKAAERFPDQPDFVEFQADTLRQLKRTAEGVAAIKRFMALPEQRDKPTGVLMLATLYARDGRAIAAINDLQDFLAAHPGPQPEVRIRLAQLLRMANRLEDALKLLAGADDHPDIRRERVEMLIGVGRLDEARSIVDKAMSVEPTPELHTLAALIELRSGKIDDAMASVQQGLKLNPNYPGGLYYRAVIGLNMPRPDHAAVIADLRRVKELVPGNVENRLLLAEVLQTRNDFEAAISELEGIVAERPTERRAVLRLVDLYVTRSTPPRYNDAVRIVRAARDQPGLSDSPELLNAEAAILLSLNRPAKAEPVIRKALSVQPGSIELQRTFVRTLAALQRYDEIGRFADAGLRQAPEEPWLHLVRGVAQAGLRNRGAAMQSFAKALELCEARNNRPLALQVIDQAGASLGGDAARELLGKRFDDPGWKLYVARLYERERQLDKAIDLVEAVLANRSSLKPVQVQEALRQASQLYQTKIPVDFDKAYEALKELLTEVPEDPEVLNNLAYLLVGPDAPGGREKEALKYSSKSFELLSRSGPVNPYVADTHAWVLILNNQLDEGVRILEEVLARKEFAEAYLHIGEGYLRKKAAQQALSSLKRGREVLERPENQVPGSDVAILRARIDDAIARAQRMAEASGDGGGN